MIVTRLCSFGFRINPKNPGGAWTLKTVVDPPRFFLSNAARFRVVASRDGATDSSLIHQGKEHDNKEEDE